MDILISSISQKQRVAFGNNDQKRLRSKGQWKLGGDTVRRMVFVVVLSVMIGLLMNFTSVRADFYKWIDDKGDVHFTDEYSNIPEKYLPVIETRKTPIESPVSSVNKKPTPEPAPESPKSVEQETSSVFRGVIKEIDKTARTIVVTGAVKTMVFPVPEDTTIITYFGKHILFTELRAEMSVVVEHIQKGEEIHTLKIKLETMPSGVETRQELKAEGKYEGPKYGGPTYAGPKYVGPKYEGPKYKAPKK